MPSRSERPVTAAVVLAAGASTRMGTNKMRLPLDGEPLVRRAARIAIEAGLTPVIIVVGNEADEVRAELTGIDCDFVLNPNFTGPTSASLHRGLARVPGDVDAAVVLLGDMVAVTVKMIRSLVDAAGTGAPLVVSRYGDVVAPPLLFRRALFPELLAWTGEGCGKAVVNRHRAEAMYLDWPTSALTDVDTPADFAAVAARSAGADFRPGVHHPPDAPGLRVGDVE